MLSSSVPENLRLLKNWTTRLFRSLKRYPYRTAAVSHAVLFFAFSFPQFSLCSSANSTELEIRLRTRITSFASKPGDRFESVVLSPWVVNDHVVIPQGSIVRGHVECVSSVGLGLRHERAKMQLVFDYFVTADGQTFPLAAKLASIDNAREEVTPGGTIRGVIAARQPNALIFGVWHFPSMSLFSRSLIGLTGISHQIWSASSTGPIGAGGMLALRLIFFRFPEPEIHFNPGTDMRLAVNAARQQGVAEIPSVPLAASPEVVDWLLKEPFAVDREDSRPVGDIVNVAFLGSREQLIHSFAAAGWVAAEAKSRKTLKQLYYSFNSMRAYATAPVSALFYKGLPPEVVFEKSLNTITKRHHVRVWYAGMADGKELWLGAATHDTGIAFNPRSFSFTHKIAPNIDEERDKITTDLRFAGCLEPEMRVERTAAASNGLTHIGITDGAAAVLPLTDCQISGLPAGPDPKPGNTTSRLVRRMILESRNHMLRENPYYWTYQFVRYKRNRPNQPESN